jgi:hypothetical protein
MFNVGSTVDMRDSWSKHMYDTRHANWAAFSLARHFGQCHRRDLDANINMLEVILLACCSEENYLKKLEDIWMFNLWTLFDGGFNTRNEVVNHMRRNYGGS